MADEPLTEELLRELLASPSPAAFADAHRINHPSLPIYLQNLLEEKGLKRSAVVKAAGINPTFGYQIFMGDRNPSRDKLLQFAFAMGCTLTETNRMLRLGGVNELYCKNRRDAIIIFCVDRACTLAQTDEQLYRFGEETVSG